MNSSVPTVELRDDDDMVEQVVINLDDEINFYDIPVITLDDDPIDENDDPVVNVEIEEIPDVIIEDNDIVECCLESTHGPQNIAINKGKNVNESISVEPSDVVNNSDIIEVTPQDSSTDIIEITETSSKSMTHNAKLKNCKFCRKKCKEMHNAQLSCVCSKSEISNPLSKVPFAKENIKSSLYTNNAVKPYACDICFKAFSDKNILRMHYNTHTGEKPFACNICDKVFSNTVALKNHYEIHIGEKPYVCDVCLSSFDEKSTLCGHKLDEHHYLTVI